MFLVTSNKAKQLLYVNYVGQVRLEELQQGLGDIAAQLKDLPPGFRVLVDFSRMDSMELGCAPEIGRAMDIIGKAGVRLVVRIISNPHQDIGLNILAAFHYPRQPKPTVVTCETMTEAVRRLAL